MHRLRTAIVLGVLNLPGISAAEWYFCDGESPTTIRLHVGEQSMPIAVRKVDLPVSAVVLRRDSERVDWYWLEVTLPETRDSDGHMLVIDGRAVGQIPEPGQVYTRGNRWAIGFISLEQARRCFDYLRNFHRLDAAHAHDATKD
jgi:hypothetical protein